MAIVFFSVSVIASQLKILHLQSILITGACIGCFTLLCILFPVWLGFPCLIIAGIFLVFLAIQIFRFPQVHSPSSVLGVCTIKVDSGSQQSAEFQLLPEKRIETIAISAADSMDFEFLVITSKLFYPLYGGSSWVILRTCVVGSQTYHFLQSDSLMLAANTPITQFFKTLFGLQPSNRHTVIGLQNIEKNIKHHMEWRQAENDPFILIPW